MKQLEAKIAELEKRIAALEARPVVYRSQMETLHEKYAPPIQVPFDPKTHSVTIP